MNDFYTEYMQKQNKRNKMELVRIILPVAILILQVIILVKLI